MKNKLFIIIVSFSFFQIFVRITLASTITLGSGVNITDGTIIRLTGTNTNITVENNHTINKLEVYSNFLLTNTSLIAPTYILNLPYNYSSSTINITGRSNIETNLTVNISNFGEGIKIYYVSSPSYLTYVSWLNATQNFSFIVNASSGTNSTIQVYWPYSFAPRSVSCNGCSVYSSSFNSTTNITTLIANHSSLVTWILFAQLPYGSSCTGNSECLNGYCVHNICRSSSTYCGDGYCDSGESCSSCSLDCVSCPRIGDGSFPPEEEISEVLECSVCPDPTGWSRCVNDEQTRINYRCSEETNYICESYTEVRDCEVIKEEISPINILYDYWYVWIIIGIIFLLSFYKIKVK